jgi:hypothetical protein
MKISPNFYLGKVFINYISLKTISHVYPAVFPTLRHLESQERKRREYYYSLDANLTTENPTAGQALSIFHYQKRKQTDETVYKKRSIALSKQRVNKLINYAVNQGILISQSYNQPSNQYIH